MRQWRRCKASSPAQLCCACITCARSCRALAVGAAAALAYAPWKAVVADAQSASASAAAAAAKHERASQRTKRRARRGRQRRRCRRQQLHGLGATLVQAQSLRGCRASRGRGAFGSWIELCRPTGGLGAVAALPNGLRAREALQIGASAALRELSPAAPAAALPPALP